MAHSMVLRSRRVSALIRTPLWSTFNKAAFFSSKPSSPSAHIAIDFGNSKSRVAVLVENGSAAAKVIYICKGETRSGITGWKRVLGTDLSDYSEHINTEDLKIRIGKMLEALLSNLKQEAESYLKTSVSRAVLTYPFYFNPLWLRILVKAGLNTGFDKMHTLDDPTATAIAYGLNNKEPGCVFAVIDFGGWSFNISIMQVSANGRFVSKAPTKCDMSFGGEKFDNALVDHLLVKNGDMSDECRIRLQSKDVIERERAREFFEGIKIELSSTFEIPVTVPRSVVVPGDPSTEFLINTTLTRTEFESFVNDLFERMRNCIESYLEEARISAMDIDEVLLVGGMARVPRVQEIVSEIFGKLPSGRVANLEEAVVLGAAAAVQAGHFGQNPWND